MQLALAPRAQQLARQLAARRRPRGRLDKDHMDRPRLTFAAVGLVCLRVRLQLTVLDGHYGVQGAGEHVHEGSPSEHLRGRAAVTRCQRWNTVPVLHLIKVLRKLLSVPRATIHVRCRHGPARAGHAAPLHRVHPWGVSDPSLASQPMQRARGPEMLVGSDRTSQRLRTRRSLQEARDHHYVLTPIGRGVESRVTDSAVDTPAARPILYCKP